MTRNLPDAVRRLVADYDIRTEEMWLVPGGKVYAIKHTAIERMAALAGIQFDPPQVLEGSGADKVVALMGTARLGTRTEWSIGEAAPSNNKNAYPWAIAEKRLKGRLTLKLLSAYGTVYSEEEAEDFKQAEKPRVSSYAIKRDKPDLWPKLEQAVREANTVDDLTALWHETEDDAERWPKTWQDARWELFEARTEELRKEAAE